MSSPLGLNIGAENYVPASKPTFAAQPVSRNPAVAFFLSLLLPGLGQFYCRKNSRGAWTLSFFIISAGATIWLTPMLIGPNSSGFALAWGVLLRVAVFLYGFAFLDAYFTAREMTVGTDPFIAESPRIAAILNLLTRGFGYFYLGQRAAGFAVFIGLGIFQQTILRGLGARNEPQAALFLELLLAGMGVHAYLIARKREKEILATIQPAPQTSAIRGLPPAVPLALAVLLAAAYLGLCCIGFVLPDYSTLNQTPAHISKSAQSTVYSNPVYGVEFSAPAAWLLEDQDTKLLVTARRSDSVCAAELRLAAWSPLLPLSSYARALSAQLAQPENKGSRLVQDDPTTLSGISGRSIVLALDSRGIQLWENQIAVRKGMTFYVLSMDSLAESAPECQSDFAFIQQHVSLPK